jgi:hypothetical protein
MPRRGYQSTLRRENETRLGVRRLIAAGLIVVVLLLPMMILSGISVAAAQTPAPTGTDQTTDASDETDEAAENTQDFRWLSVLLLVFTGGVVAGTLLYLTWAQREYFRLVGQTLARLGKVPEAEDVPPTVRLLAEVDRLDVGKLDIVGDTVVTVGQPVEFTAKAEDVPVEATWEVDPRDAAEVKPETGQTVKVTAKKVATFLVKAGAGEGTERREGAQPVSAVTVEPGRVGSIRFVGAGWISLLIAMVVVAVVGVLALSGVLASETVATLFGALLGYIFLRAAGQRNGDAGDAGDSSGGDASTEGSSGG